MAKSRANGEGSIRQREDGRWEGRMTIGRDPSTGRQRQKSIYAKTQRQLLEQMRHLQHDLEDGVDLSPSKMTVEDWMKRWLLNYVKPTCAPSTFDSYQMLVNVHVLPEIGHALLSALTTDILQEFYARLLSGGRVLTKGKSCSDLSLSTATVHKIRNIMRKALSQAVWEHLIRSNPDDGCKLPRVRSKTRNILPDANIAEFLHYVRPSEYYPLFVLELATGLRRGEILGLAWDCIHFDANTVDVKQQLVRRNGQTVIVDILKTDHSVRTLLVDDTVMHTLQVHKAKQGSTIGDANSMNLVFCNTAGKPYYPTTIPTI